MPPSRSHRRIHGMSFFEPNESSKPDGPDEARRKIDIYGAELAAMAVVVMSHYENFDPPAGVICEPGTTEGESLSSQLNPRLPIRVVEDGTTIAVYPREALRDLIRVVAPDCESYLDKPEFIGPGRMPILAVCRAGSLMGVVDYESPVE